MFLGYSLWLMDLSERLRASAKEMTHDAFSYGIPAVRLDGQPLVWR